MIFKGKALDKINEEDLKRLIEDRVGEGQYVEYKSQMYNKTEKRDWRELFKDVSAIANAEGGFLIIGIEEDKEGYPHTMAGISNGENEKDRILSACDNSILERILGIKIFPIPVREEKSVLVIFIPKSTRAPHVVTYEGWNRFFIRRDRHNRPMTIFEIKDLCLKVENYTTKLEDFLEKRKLWIKKKFKKAVFYFSATPVFLRGDIIDTAANEIRDLVVARGIPSSVEPQLSSTYFEPPTPSINGLISRVDRSPFLEPASCFELFRNGHCEIRLKISHWQTKDGKVFIYPQALMNYIVLFNYILKNICEKSEFYEDLACRLAVYNAGDSLKLPEGMRFDYDDKENQLYKHWDVDEDLETDLVTFKDIHPMKIAETMLDRLYNAFGLENCPYLENGLFV